MSCVSGIVVDAIEIIEILRINRLIVVVDLIVGREFNTIVGRQILVIGWQILVVGWKLIIVGWQISRVLDRHTVVGCWWKQIIVLQRQVIDWRCKRDSILIVWSRREILTIRGISCSDVIVTKAQNVRIKADIVVKQFLLVTESEGRSTFEMMGRGWVGAFKMVGWAFKMMRRSLKVGSKVRRWSLEMGSVMRWAMFKMRVMIEWKMRGWRRISMKMLVFVIMQSAFLVRKESGNRANDSLIWGEMKIHERLKQFLAVFTFGDLEGEERIHIEQSQVEAVGSESAEVFVVNVVPIRTDWIMAIVAGVRQSETDAKSGNDFLSAVTSAVRIITARSGRAAQTKNSLRENNKTTQLSSGR